MNEAWIIYKAGNRDVRRYSPGIILILFLMIVAHIDTHIQKLSLWWANQRRDDDEKVWGTCLDFCSCLTSVQLFSHLYSLIYRILLIYQ